MYYATDLWNKQSPYLAHYGVKGMRWGHRKIIEPTYDQYHRRLQTFNDKTAVRKSKPSRLSRGAKIAIGVGGALAAYGLAKKFAYSGAGIQDPKILSKYISLNREIAKHTIGKIGPVMAKNTVSAVKKSLPGTISFLKKAGKVTQSKIIPRLVSPYTRSAGRFGSAVYKQTKNNGAKVAKNLLKSTTVKASTDIDIPFIKSYFNGTRKMPNDNPELRRRIHKEVRRMDRTERLLRL